MSSNINLENVTLMFQNDDLRRRLSAMESELMVLQHSVSHTYTYTTYRNYFLNIQLKTHEEDFEQERRDRVRIHEEREKLQQQLESQEQVIKMLVCIMQFYIVVLVLVS